MIVVRNILLIFLGAVLVLCLLGWVGLQVQPRAFPDFPEETPELKTIALPEGLPAPVERFYKTVYGVEIPVIETVIIRGRGTMKPFLNIPIPARFVFVHNAGRDYRHYFEVTLFGIPLMKVNEGYLDGQSFFESPMATFRNEPNANQGANLALWAEGVWFPSLWVTDPRVHWEPVDEYTALLHVPYEDGGENFVVRFNPRTGLIDLMEAMRYRETGDGREKILWITISGDGGDDAVMWLDQGKPWAHFNLEQVVYNTDVSKMIQPTGGIGFSQTAPEGGGKEPVQSKRDFIQIISTGLRDMESSAENSSDGSTQDG